MNRVEKWNYREERKRSLREKNEKTKRGRRVGETNGLREEKQLERQEGRKIKEERKITEWGEGGRVREWRKERWGHSRGGRMV